MKPAAMKESPTPAPICCHVCGARLVPDAGGTMIPARQFSPKLNKWEHLALFMTALGDPIRPPNNAEVVRGFQRLIDDEMAAEFNRIVEFGATLIASKQCKQPDQGLMLPPSFNKILGA